MTETDACLRLEAYLRFTTKLSPHRSDRRTNHTTPP
jgi:hypothetical protein